MSGPLPKDPALRQRRNKIAGATTLPAGPRRRRKPGLPEREPEAKPWHALTVAWWEDVWRSPMAREYLKADVHGLYRLAVLVDLFWYEPSVMLAAEIRQQQMGFGLTPIDRRRLQWEVEKVESVVRKKKSANGNRPMGIHAGEDPRDLFRAVK